MVKGLTGIRTQNNRFKVCGANRYTIRPSYNFCGLLFYFIVVNVAVMEHLYTNCKFLYSPTSHLPPPTSHLPPPIFASSEIRTHEAYALGLKSNPFNHSGIDAHHV